MLGQVLAWFPGYTFTLVGDGAYASKGLLVDLDERVPSWAGCVGMPPCTIPMSRCPSRSGEGRKPRRGVRPPCPKEAAAKADRKRTDTGPWLWQEVSVLVYGCQRLLKACTYEVVWPTVLGLRPIRVVVVRDPEGRMRDAYLFTTDLTASPQWVITRFAWRLAIEVPFRASKQIMDIEGPQHWSQESVEKLRRGSGRCKA